MVVGSNPVAVTDYILNWKSKGSYTSKLKPLYNAFVHSIKLSGCGMGITFHRDPLAVEQNNYFSKIVNVYIGCDLDAWAKKCCSFQFKNCLFEVTSIVKNSDKEKCVYSGYEITCNSAVSCSLNNDTARNVIIFGVDNSLSSHSDNCKNIFIVLGEGPIVELLEAFCYVKVQLWN